MADLVDALVCTQLNAPYEVKKARIGDLREDEILVRMEATGICHADILITNVSQGPFSRKLS